VPPLKTRAFFPPWLPRTARLLMYFRFSSSSAPFLRGAWRNFFPRGIMRPFFFLTPRSSTCYRDGEPFGFVDELRHFFFSVQQRVLVVSRSPSAVADEEMRSFSLRHTCRYSKKPL